MVVEFGERMIFPALVLKGIVEHEDAGAYFHSVIHLRRWINEVDRLGWISERSDIRKDKRLIASPDGVSAYFVLCLDHLPKERGTSGYGWDWRKRFGRYVNVLDTDAPKRHSAGEEAIDA